MYAIKEQITSPELRVFRSGALQGKVAVLWAKIAALQAKISALQARVAAL